MTDGVLVCGLGLRPENDATLETLAALEACRVVYCALEDPAQFRWLGGYFPALRRAEKASEIVSAARHRPGVGLAVWGHPCYTSRLALDVQARCAQARISLRFMAATSPLGTALARAGEFLGGDEGHAGAQAYALDALLARPALLLARLPAVVYAERAPRASWARLAKLLKARYPAGHPILEFDELVFIPPYA